MAKVDILMATFNGSKYLREQIDSILDQTFQDFKIIIHDDGSTDETVSIVVSYLSRYPEKIKYIDDGIRTGGPKNNFFHLLQFSRADYIMFADQDDVWLRDKIEITFNRLVSECDENKPCLVHTDLVIVDHELNIIAPSMRDFQMLTTPLSKEDALLKNSVTGCTVMFNYKLRNLIKISDEIIMHDWWLLIMVMANRGCLVYINEPTILYRQHASNEVGAKQKTRLNDLTKLVRIKSFYSILKKQYQQYLLIKPISFGIFLWLKFKCWIFT